jgi:hypothetical protein
MNTPVFSIGTAGSPVSVWISKVPNSTGIKDGPSVLLQFDERHGNDAHVWGMVSTQPDQGALRVRHEVKVHRTARDPKDTQGQVRIALICRTVRPYAPQTIQLHDLRNCLWLARAKEVLMDKPRMAIQADLSAGTLGHLRLSHLRTLFHTPDSFGWPLDPQLRFLGLLSPATLNGVHGAGAVLSAQPQVLSHFGYHSGNKGLSIGGLRVNGLWVATSLLLNFKEWEVDSSGTLRGLTRYQNMLSPPEYPESIQCQGPDGDGAVAFREIMVQSCDSSRPIRILIKFCASSPPPCVQYRTKETNLRVLALCLAVVTDCCEHLNTYTLEVLNTL